MEVVANYAIKTLDQHSWTLPWVSLRDGMAYDWMTIVREGPVTRLSTPPEYAWDGVTGDRWIRRLLPWVKEPEGRRIIAPEYWPKMEYSEKYGGPRQLTIATLHHDAGYQHMEALAVMWGCTVAEARRRLDVAFLHDCERANWRYDNMYFVGVRLFGGVAHKQVIEVPT